MVKLKCMYNSVFSVNKMLKRFKLTFMGRMK